MLSEIKKAVETGKLKKIEGFVNEALEKGAEPDEILDAMIESMGVVGEKFQRNEVFVPEMLIAAATMKKAVAVLRPLLTGNSLDAHGTFIIGTVAGDMHDIGKNLVALMVESAGFKVVDLGVDVPAEKFVEAIKTNPDCRVVGISGLLTTTMEAMRDTVKAIDEAGLHDRVKIMVGGAPITQAFADEIGADAYTVDAGSAAVMAKQLAG